MAPYHRNLLIENCHLVPKVHLYWTYIAFEMTQGAEGMTIKTTLRNMPPICR